MKPSVWSGYFTDLSPEKMVETFSLVGWEYSELSDEHAAMLLERGRAELVGRQFRSFSEDHGFSFPQGHLWLTCDIAASNQQDILEKLKDWLDLFNVVGIKSAVLHPGGYEMKSEGCHPDRILDAQVRALRYLTDYIQGTDMTICLENVVATAPEAGDLLKIIHGADVPGIGICLDTGHLNMCSGDQTGFIHQSDPFLKALHIADNEGKTDQHMMPFGRGNVPWLDVREALKRVEYKGLYNFEIPGERQCPLEVRLLKLDYIRKLLPVLTGD